MHTSEKRLKFGIYASFLPLRRQGACLRGAGRAMQAGRVLAWHRCLLSGVLTWQENGRTGAARSSSPLSNVLAVAGARLGRASPPDGVGNAAGLWGWREATVCRMDGCGDRGKEGGPGLGCPRRMSPVPASTSLICHRDGWDRKEPWVDHTRLIFARCKGSFGQGGGSPG